MQALIDFLGAYLSDEVILRRTVIVVITATIFVLGMGIATLVMSATNPVRRRLGMIGAEEEPTDRIAVRIATAIGPISAYVLPKAGLERSKALSNLSKAGFRSPQALQVFYAIKTLATLCLPVLILLTAQFFPTVGTKVVIYSAMFSAGIGIVLPGYFLDKAIARRLRKLRNGFPDALDLLVVCVESGLSLGPALQRVSEELSVNHPVLSFELGTVTAEMRAGVPRETALKNLAERTGLADIRGFVGLLVQSMKFGTSVADALRIYSEEFRDRRMQAAEEIAAKLSTKMIFPLIFCMFPTFFIVAVGPAVLRLMDAFGRLAVE